MRKKVSMVLVSLMIMGSLAACGSKENSSSAVNKSATLGNDTEINLSEKSADTENEKRVNKKQENENATSTAEESEKFMKGKQESEKQNSETEEQGTENEKSEKQNRENSTTSGAEELFTDRDLTMEADLSNAETIELSDGKDVTIDKEGVYVIKGTAKNSSLVIDADKESKVQLVLDGVNISNETVPCIYVKKADKVFVTTTNSENNLEVSGTFTNDGENDLDAVIFSKEDIVINGLGTVNIKSTDNAVSSKDTLKITGGTINIDCDGNALRAHDSIDVYDGKINIANCNDGLHAEDSDDDSLGSINICNGEFNIVANDDAIHATTTIKIEGGTFDLVGRECMEGTYIEIDDGNIKIEASDDGINAAAKSDKYTPTFILNGGNVTIEMGQGDTDGVDSNGNIYINGGVISINGQSTFDYDGEAVYSGGTIIENGQETNEISNQFMGGGHGGMREPDGMGGRP